MILGPFNRSGAARPIVGADNHVYEVFHNWGDVPHSIRYGNTHGVCVDSQGYIYVLHTATENSQCHDTVVVFDEVGRYVRSWGPEFIGGAHGLHIHWEGSEEFLYLCDTNRSVIVKSTLRGEQVWSIGYPYQSSAYNADGNGNRIKYSPTNIATAANGDIYVSDGYGSSYVNQYNRNGEYISTFGGFGEAAGKLNCPHGIIVDMRDNDSQILTIADRGNKRIQRFTLEGKHIDFVTGTNMPCHFSYYKNGDMVVPDLGARVTLMDRDNKVIIHLGDDSTSDWRKMRTEPPDKFTPGKFIAPHSACFDHFGNIFVVEWVEVGRVTKLRKV